MVEFKGDSRTQTKSEQNGSQIDDVWVFGVKV